MDKAEMLFFNEVLENEGNIAGFLGSFALGNLVGLMASELIRREDYVQAIFPILTILGSIGVEIVNELMNPVDPASLAISRGFGIGLIVGIFAPVVINRLNR